MRKSGSAVVGILALVSAGLLLSGAAHAQPRGGGGYRRACLDDIERLCAEAGSRRDEVVACLEGRRDELSEACRSQLSQRQAHREARMEAVRQACAAEVKTHCPDTEAGRQRVRCLREHQSELSDACRDALPTPRRRPR